jgi:hypothetical protein
LQVGVEGLHAMIMAPIARGARVALVGTPGQAKAAVESIKAAVDTEVKQYPIDLYYPSSETPPYRYGRRLLVILGQGAVTYQVSLPIVLAVIMNW